MVYVYVCMRVACVCRYLQTYDDDAAQSSALVVASEMPSRSLEKCPLGYWCNLGASQELPLDELLCPQSTVAPTCFHTHNTLHYSHT